MVLLGNETLHAPAAEAMANEFYDNVKVGIVRDSGHYLAEENPQGFIFELLRCIET